MTNMELREAVAAEVMEWHYTNSRSPGHNRGWKKPGGKNPDEAHAERLPAYESDIATAWEVVEKMRELGFRVKCKDVGNGNHEWCFEDFFKGHCREHRWATSEYDSYAICQAALSAVRAIKDKEK